MTSDVDYNDNDGVIRNFSACLSKFGVFIRNWSACFEKASFLYAGSYCNAHICSRVFLDLVTLYVL